VADLAKMRICRAAVQIKAAVQLLGKENDRQQERKNIESLAVSAPGLADFERGDGTPDIVIR
jgi:hypothetical protein